MAGSHSIIFRMARHVRREIASQLALVVLSGFGWLIFKTIRWVEESSREQEQDAADSDRDRP